MNPIRIRYVRLENRTPVGVVVLLPGGHIGWSQCNPKDQFSKARGKDIAIARAITGSAARPALVNRKPLMHDAIGDMMLWAMDKEVA